MENPGKSGSALIAPRQRPGVVSRVSGSTLVAERQEIIRPTEAVRGVPVFRVQPKTKSMREAVEQGKQEVVDLRSEAPPCQGEDEAFSA